MLALKLDPEFVRQLNDAADQEPVQVVVRLQPANAQSVVPAPDETERIARDLIRRTEHETGQTAEAINVFRNLGAFAVAAVPVFLRTLIEQPEVAAVVANRQPGAAMIAPVAKRPVDFEEVGQASHAGRTRKKRVI